MKKTIAFIFALCPTAALADEPTVALTASELQAVITAELARAQAAGAIDKIGKALRPKQAAAEPVAPEQAAAEPVAPEQAAAEPVAPERPK
jgi:hypothetical protein